MRLKLLVLVLSVTVNSAVFAQMDSVHIPWILDGANERIEEYRKGNVTLKFRLADGNMLTAQVPIVTKLAKHDFKFGASLAQTWAYDHDDDNYDTYRNSILNLFNYITQSIFWSQVHRTEGSIDIPQYILDNIQWAQNNNLTMKGMPLVWHIALPTWLKEATDLDTIDARIKYHVRYLLEAFPEIYEWGVYNEAVAAFQRYVQESGVTRWVEYKGGVTTAVEYLFNLVNEIAPNNKYINNHYAPQDPEFKNLNQHLLSTNAGLGAVGIQTHMHSETEFLTETEMWNFLEEYSAYGKIQLSEVTVPSSVPFKDWKEIQEFEAQINEARQNGEPTPIRPSTPAREKFQAEYLKDFYTLAFSHPAVEAVILWDISDLNAWRGAAGGILDLDHNPKPAYDTLKKLIKEEWQTEINDHLQTDGSITFSAFFGEYTGYINIDNIDYPFNFTHSTKDTTIIIDIDIAFSNVNIPEKSLYPAIYPSPVSDQLFIELPELAEELILFNSQGSRISSIQPDSKASCFDLSKQPVGIYFLQVKAKKRVKVHKSIKQKSI